MKTLSSEAAGDIVQCCCELRWKLFGIEERWARFEGRGNAGFADGSCERRHFDEAQDVEDDDLTDVRLSGANHRFIRDGERS